MEKKGSKEKENRRHPRIAFKPEERPILSIDGKKFQVENISEGGIRFSIDETVKFKKDISGTLTFSDGETVTIEGRMIWKREDVVGLSFFNLLPASLVNRKYQEAFLKTKIAIPTLGCIPEVETLGYTFQHLTKLKIGTERLKEWVACGYIEPSVQKEGSPGTKNLFSRFDLYLIKLFDYLTARGITSEEASLRIKILCLAEKKSSTPFHQKTFLGFSRKIDLSKIPKDLKQKMMQWLFEDSKPGGAEEKKMKQILKSFVPVLLEEKDDALMVPSALYKECEDILIVNFKKIREQVDAVIQ